MNELLTDFSDLRRVEQALERAREDDDHFEEIRIARGALEGFPIQALRFHQASTDSLDLGQLLLRLMCSWPIVLCEPLHARLCWSTEHARLFACDCAEHGLRILEHEFPELIPRLSEAADLARHVIRGELPEDVFAELHQAADNATRTLNKAYEALPWSARPHHLHTAVWGIRGLADPDPDGLIHKVLSAFTAEHERENEFIWQAERLLEYLLGLVDVF